MTIFLFTGGSARVLFQVNKRSLIYFVISSSYSLITLMLSFLLLRNVEQLSFKIVIATILVVGGVALLTLSR